MDESFSPGKILLRLEELKKWQKIQEMHLLEQQGLQRIQFAEQQAKAYSDTLNLSNSLASYYDYSSNENTPNSNFSTSQKSSRTSKSNGTSFEYSNSNMEGVSPRNNFKFEYLNYKSKGHSLLNNSKYENSKREGPSPLNDSKYEYSNSNVEGVSPLNISKESEPLLVVETPQNQSVVNSPQKEKIQKNELKIKLDEIPILPSAKDFRSMVEEKIKNEKQEPRNVGSKKKAVVKRQFLKKGEGMNRFNMSTNDIGLKNSVPLPWLKNIPKVRPNRQKKVIIKKQALINDNKKQVVEDELKKDEKCKLVPNEIIEHKKINEEVEENASKSNISTKIEKPQKTWAAVLSDEQNQYLKLLKKTDIYQQYSNSPGEYQSDSSVTMSPSFKKVSLEKEAAEQNMFELLENKVENSSFCSTSSFYAKVINSGFSTPSINREYVKSYSHLLHLKPNVQDINVNENTESSIGTEQSSDECSECSHSHEHIQEESQHTVNDDTDCSESTDTENTCNVNTKIQTSTPIQARKMSQNNQNDDKGDIHDERKTNELSNNETSNDGTLVGESNSNSECENDKHLISNEESIDLITKTKSLKQKLKELQSEIEVIRKENEAVAKIKADLENEKEGFMKEKAEVERKINEDKIIAEYYLAEEKEKLAKQKMLYDRHVKEMRGKSMKKDREELASLKAELVELKEHIATKDARTGAAQARMRNQIKILEKENMELKEECEKLNKDNRRLNNATARSKRLANIKSLAEINKTLAKFTIDNKMINSDEEIQPPDDIYSSHLIKRNQEAKTIKPTVIKNARRPRSKSVPNLTRVSHYAKYFSQKDEELKMREEEELGYGLQSDSDSDISGDTYEVDHSCYENVSLPLKTNAKFTENNKQGFGLERTNRKSEVTERHLERKSNDIERMYHDKFQRLSQEKLKTSEQCFESNPTNVSGLPSILKPTNFPNKPIPKPDNPIAIDQQDVEMEFLKPDGSKETVFKNGNRKCVSADGAYGKFTYFNGDVKETFYNEGTVKYFYKEMNTYHTTYRDGTQVIQFPDGHLERRFKDGSVEAHLPGGATRWSRPDGCEEWKFQDGIIVMVNPNGEQILRFPNGQTEIHTKDHKRREYPDGSVKVVYADGMAETRYANGRIRVKDKHGNLIMDSGEQQETTTLPTS